MRTATPAAKTPTTATPTNTTKKPTHIVAPIQLNYKTTIPKTPNTTNELKATNPTTQWY